MVSPQDPTPTGTVSTTSTTGRGFVTAEEGRAVVYSQPQSSYPGTESFRSTVSWGSVIAGSIFAIAFLLLSASLAAAIGVTAYRGGEYGWGAGLWAIVTAAVVYYGAGCIAAYLSGPGNRMSATPVDIDRDRRSEMFLSYGPMLHGVMAWALSLPLIMLLAGGLGAGAWSMANNVNDANVRMTQTLTNWGNLSGASWGIFLSLLTGLIFAAIGGASVWPRGTNR